MDYSDKKAGADSLNILDFTVNHYKELCDIAIKNYTIVDYLNIPWGKKFLLWRHDLDISLNRGLALARIEHEIGIKATYFLNIHSEFYNLAEFSQHKIVKEILDLGHDIGLHFYADFFDEITEVKLHDLVKREADYLEWLFNVRPVAFSFHNPVTSTLNFEADIYGGLLNCYSKKFKTEVSYCSDSNGYWRFRRLYDVLTDAIDPCLQVLTHPGWWQETPMPPRQRIFRSAFGRAAGILRTYDEALRQYGRLNQSGKANFLHSLVERYPSHFQICDYLWNSGHFQSLFVELWRLHERQINRLCKAELRKQWRVPAFEVNAFFETPSLVIHGWQLFAGVFGKTLQDAVCLDDSSYRAWLELRNILIHGRESAPQQRLEEGCVFLCSTIQSLADWGKAQSLQYDGISPLDCIGIRTYKMANGDSTDRLEEIAYPIPSFKSSRWDELLSLVSQMALP